MGQARLHSPEAASCLGSHLEYPCSELFSLPPGSCALCGYPESGLGGLNRLHWGGACRRRGGHLLSFPKLHWLISLGARIWFQPKGPAHTVCLRDAHPRERCSASALPVSLAPPHHHMRWGGALLFPKYHLVCHSNSPPHLAPLGRASTLALPGQLARSSEPSDRAVWGTDLQPHHSPSASVHSSAGQPSPFCR